MKILYKNNKLESVLIAINAVTAAAVLATFVMNFGFDKPVLPTSILYIVQITCLVVFVFVKPIRLYNCVSRLDYLRVSWFEIPLLGGLLFAILGAGRWFHVADAGYFEIIVIEIYLVVQVVSKVCRTAVGLAASGKNPTQSLIISFVVLIICGAGLLMLPKALNGGEMSFVDSLFTATSATCVTGLVVKDTGSDFSLMGQVIILSLIQLGGLGIMIFGAVFALLLGQALSVRESVAMQDLLNAQTLGRIANLIGFIFIVTLGAEALGAFAMYGVWGDYALGMSTGHEQWFFSIFHSISAFCNAGFGLFNDSLVRMKGCWAVYAVICPLIVVGGLGFPVLYNVCNVLTDILKRWVGKFFFRRRSLSARLPKRFSLQTKIVLSMSVILIIAGAAGLMVFENNCHNNDNTANYENPGISGAVFQSITARTAGFNTVDIKSLSAASKMLLIVLMVIGGSPASTAGGIKTVTFAIILMSAYATLRKRQEVEIFGRSLRLITLGRALTVAILYISFLFVAIGALCLTERHCGFAMGDIMFEEASALGTVGLTTGITGSLTTAGKFIIIISMLVGRLGPLTLLASLTFNMKVSRYNYPSEAVLVG